MIGEISLEMTFDAGHRIVGHKGKCARLHGHTYRAEIVCRGEVQETGFVVDFGDLKDLVNQWDHRMLLWVEDLLVIGQERENVYFKEEEESGIVRVPFNPTAENMVNHLAICIGESFSLHYVDVDLWETPKCSARATWVAEDVF